MRDQIVVQRYADAFVGFARETIGIETAVRQMKDLKNNVVNNNPEFLEFLENPQFTYSEKNAFIDNVLGSDFQDETKNFLKLLLTKGRIDKLTDIIEYIRVTYSYGEEVEAILRTAFPLDTELIRLIKQDLEKKFKQRFKLYIDLDGRLLGGVQVIIGNRIIDGTLRKRLDEIKEKLMLARV